MTPHIQNLQTSSPYTGTDSVIVGNGCSLPITHVGLSSLPNSLQLHNILHVPLLTKNLLSVQRFSHDYHCFFILDDHGFCVKDKRTGRTLLSGPSSHGSYRASISPSSPSVCLSTKSTSSLWHLRLGHPSHASLWRTLSAANIKSPSVKTFCTTCPLGKSTNKPFQTRQHTASSSLELLHLDL